SKADQGKHERIDGVWCAEWTDVENEKQAECQTQHCGKQRRSPTTERGGNQNRGNVQQIRCLAAQRRRKRKFDGKSGGEGKDGHRIWPDHSPSRAQLRWRGGSGDLTLLDRIDHPMTR